MTSPPRSITIVCPNCGRTYTDWHRASVNADLDPSMAQDADYMRQATTAVCPECGHMVEFASLIVRDDVWTVNS